MAEQVHHPVSRRSRASTSLPLSHAEFALVLVCLTLPSGALTFLQFKMYRFFEGAASTYSAAYYRSRLGYYGFLTLMVGALQVALGERAYRVVVILAYHPSSSRFAAAAAACPQAFSLPCHYVSRFGAELRSHNVSRHP